MVKINNFLLHFFRIIYWKCPAEKPGDGISKTLNFKIFGGACPQTPLVVSAFGDEEKFILVRTSSKSHATPLETWKQCQWINEYAHLQTQNLREKLVILEALFKSFSCFQCSWNLLGIFIDDWSQDCQVYKRNLSCCSFQWNQTTWTWGCVSKAYNFLKILANSVDSMLYISLFLLFLKLCFEIFPKRSRRICSNFAITEAISSKKISWYREKQR